MFRYLSLTCIWVRARISLINIPQATSPQLAILIITIIISKAHGPCPQQITPEVWHRIQYYIMWSIVSIGTCQQQNI